MFRYFRNNLITGETQNEYIVAKVSEATVGLYRCQVKNQPSETYIYDLRSDVEARILEEPMTQTAAVGRDVTLHCRINVQASPRPSNTWTFTPAVGDQSPVVLDATTAFLADDNQRLVLPNVQTSQAGNYTCTARNRVGSQTATAAVQVTEG